MTELDINGVLLLDTEDSVVVNETSVTQVDINNVVVWSRVADLPDKPESFVASDNLETYILCEWNTMGNTTSVDLYEDTLGVIEANITSPYDWHGAESGVVYSLRVIARND